LDVLTRCLFKGIPKNFYLVRKRTDFEVLTHLLHQLVVDIRNDVVLGPMFLNQNMESITAWNPSNQTSVLTERNNRVPSDS
jgi:hypothetical protein